ncbi:MAG TPA: polyisoprenoid-binding protein [Microscillaceae bacterium]|nr:polyisoprenoid-binding protein [Microscillaceae bacterium]
MKKVFLTFAALGLMASVSFAQTWKADAYHSWVNFQVMHQGLSYVNGSFSKFDATIESNGGKLAGAKLTASIDISSVNTGNKRRDGHLQSPDFFDAAKSPKATFVSKKFKKTGKNKYKIMGDLTIKGVTKPFTFEAKQMSTFKAKNGTKTGFTATGTFNRYDFGINYGKGKKTPNGDEQIGGDIKLVINMEFTSK